MPLALVLITLVLAGCAQAPADAGVVFLESDSYGCGAAEGLGCGLAIAPVLAAIDDLEGVAGSQVSWDGRHFRIEVLPGADTEQVAAAATALLEGEACCVTEPRGKAAATGPQPWYDAEETLALSQHEAGVIAADLAAEIAPDAALEPEAAERLKAVLREELEHAFERAHAKGGGVPRLWEQLPQARTAFEGRLEFLTAEQRGRVSACLERQLAER